LEGKRWQEQSAFYAEGVTISYAAKGTLRPLAGVWDEPSWRMQGREYLKEL